MGVNSAKYIFAKLGSPLHGICSWGVYSFLSEQTSCIIEKQTRSFPFCKNWQVYLSLQDWLDWQIEVFTIHASSFWKFFILYAATLKWFHQQHYQCWPRLNGRKKKLPKTETQTFLLTETCIKVIAFLHMLCFSATFVFLTLFKQYKEIYLKFKIEQFTRSWVLTELRRKKNVVSKAI